MYIIYIYICMYVWIRFNMLQSSWIAGYLFAIFKWYKPISAFSVDFFLHRIACEGVLSIITFDFSFFRPCGVHYLYVCTYTYGYIFSTLIFSVDLRAHNFDDKIQNRTNERANESKCDQFIFFFHEQFYWKDKNRSKERVPLQPTRPKYTRMMYSKSEAMIHVYVLNLVLSKWTSWINRKLQLSSFNDSA